MCKFSMETTWLGFGKTLCVWKLKQMECDSDEKKEYNWKEERMRAIREDWVGLRKVLAMTTHKENRTVKT